MPWGISAFMMLCMPSQLLHILFGEDVIAEMYRRLEGRFGIVAGKAVEKIRNPHWKAFVLGCQGPDIFYHSQGRRPVGLEYGTLLHRRGAGDFTAGLLKMGLPDPPPGEEDIRMNRREKEINALGVYALGYMTHAILDRQTHPYIVYKSDRPPPTTSRRDRSHAFLERIIDKLMYRFLRGAEISSWDQDGLLAEICEDPPPGLKELLFQALVHAFPERAGKDEKLSRRVENTFLDCAFFYRITSPSNNPVPVSSERSPAQAVLINSQAGSDPKDFFQKGRVAYLYPENLPAHIDFLNLSKEPWYYPAGERKMDKRSFPEIYEGAVKAAADSLTVVMGNYLETGLFPIEEAARAIGNGGLSIVDEKGKPCAPVRSDPFPLQEVLDEQTALRGIHSC